MIHSPLNKRSISCLKAGFLFLLVFVLFPLKGQVSESLVPNMAAMDSMRAGFLCDQSKIHLAKDSLNRALDLAGEALPLAMRAKQEDIEITALSLIANIYNRQGFPGDAIPYLMRIAHILENREDKAGLPEIYVEVAFNYQLEKVYDKEGEYCYKALLTMPEDDLKARAGLTEQIAIALMNDGMLDSSLIFFLDARSLYGSTGANDTRILNYLVQVSNKANMYRDALRYNAILFDRFRSVSNYEMMSKLQNNMGFNHTMLNEYQQAVSSYRKAIEYGEAAGIPPEELAHIRVNTGICYQNMNQGEEARQHYQEALKAFDESGLPGEQSRLENILALVYYHEGDLYNAGYFSKNSIESAREASDPKILSACYLTHSRILREGNDPVQALEYYEKYLDIRDSLEMENRLNGQALSRKRNQLEKSENDLKIKLKEEQVKELAIQQLTLQLEKEEQEKELIKKENDVQLLEQERLRQSLVITQQQHVAEQQKKENRLLEQEKRIADMRLEQEKRVQKEQEQEITLLEQQKRLDQLELSRQKNSKKVLLGFIILGILITILIMGSLVSSRRKNILLASQKKEIELKNQDLESKNEEISTQRDEIEAQRDLVYRQKDEIEQVNLEVMNSIEYARKIQSSTLPDLTSLNTTISEFFIMFRPRDIVSGDFYWTADVEGTTVLTVSDCTGHGVPGAFMSMLGMSLLKEIIQKEYITMPSVILRRLRKGIIAALGQKGISGEQRDGMDMALVSIHHASGKIQYAGAYNPLYLIRHKNHPAPSIDEMTVFEEESGNDYILYEIKAGKMPIAHYIRMDKFSTHDIDIMEGDNYYLFTDGYADQFGGPLGKKFKYKPFKRLLLQNAHLPMEKQKEILHNTLEEWMGNIAQVDDICIMGLRMKS